MDGSWKKPEDQFVGRLIENKTSKLKALDLGDLVKRDYILRISMDEIPNPTGEDRIWRRFRVSGGLKLGVFADKVIRPVMGWTRNLHTHVFTDYSDGALFGPKESTSVDMVHLDLMGFGYVPEEKWSIAHLLRKAGDKIGWLYDFGDKWYHIILVEEICSLDESSGAVYLIDGSGACPRENGSGNRTWVEDIKKFESGDRGDREDVLKDTFFAPNYEERPWITRKNFTIDQFDIGRARAAVKQALDSKGSVARGAKTFFMPLGPDPDGSQVRPPLKKHEKLQKTTTNDDCIGHFEEVVSMKRDSKATAACANCGSPHSLKLCARCKQIFYCSMDCQRAHWREKHRAECKGKK
ncbi:hypothetical protein K439DRAFT_1632012 [Ramaria rubella]|nr:hypothetical protein K439DRAFT_1632012 [Ramaria rubella]